MNVTPLDITQKQFARALRGYAREEVEGFLALVAAEFEALVKETLALRQENQRTHAQLQTAQAELERLDGELKDPQALRALAERLLREKSGMARPGEIVYRIQSRDSMETR